MGYYAKCQEPDKTTYGSEGEIPIISDGNKLSNSLEKIVAIGEIIFICGLASAVTCYSLYVNK